MTEQAINGERLKDTQRVTLVGALVNLLLTVVKLLVGWIAQSQALLADGVHSLSDLLSDALVWFAAHHAAQEPDLDHPYGHGRFETLATLGLALLLVLVAIGIGWDAVSRLFTPEALLHPGIWALYAALGSILAKEWLYHYTIRVSRRIRSDMLRANAWHHRTDAVSSIVVLVGVGGTIAGLPYLDAIAAFLVAVMIARVGWELGWPAIHELADAGLEEARLEKIRQTIESIAGVEAIHMLRTRKSGSQASVDVHVIVDPWLSVSEGHMISQMVIDNLLEQVDEISDVTVHIDPEDDEVAAPCKGLPLRNEAEQRLKRAWAEILSADQWERLMFHYLDGRVDVDIYLPLSRHQDRESSEGLRDRLQEALAGDPEFGQVKIYYG